ncbi:MAG TPA: NAD(+) kinase, partial [Gammaproteobacteria bacterium]|nr:NAD(+) kinase [Gammaproteobacteria bacterium]
TLFEEIGVEYVVENDTAQMLGVDNLATENRADLGRDCDLIVVVGGDGSILGVARDLAHSGVPILGVNRGGLGFLADIAPNQIERQGREVLLGQYRVEKHFLLDMIVRSKGKSGGSSPALNDIVVNAGTMSRMMDFSLFVDNEFVYQQRSDGLIIATPTGSTAYSLSAGGPIMHPGLDAIVVVPMFPHTLTSRPLVVRGDSKIRVELGNAADTPMVSADSQVDFVLKAGDHVEIEKHPHPLNLAYPIGHSFFDACRSKLDWASRLGGGP